MSKYYKYESTGLIVKEIKEMSSGNFQGKVVVSDNIDKKGDILSYLSLKSFEPYTPTPQELAEWGETETPKYMKSIDSDLVIEVDNYNYNIDTFSGTVVIPHNNNIIGTYSKSWLIDMFEPYKLNTATLSNDNPNKVEVSDKDIKLRLECLKLAIATNNNTLKELSYLTYKADEIYDWITKKD